MVIPSLAITDTFVAENEDEMLNLPGVEKGDICVRTDENKTYILDDKPKEVMTLAENTTELSDWVELKTPTSEVTSVNGEKGDVTLTNEDLDLYSKGEIDAKIPGVVQTTGTSTTDVMSQKAVSDNLVLGSGARKLNTNSIAIGGSTSSGTQTSTGSSVAIGFSAQAMESGCVAIGEKAKANKISGVAIGEGSTVGTYSNGTAIGTSAQLVSNAKGSVALGYLSKAREELVVSVGSGDTYNDYTTRRIVNVKDPVNNQDAATKKYVGNYISMISSDIPILVQEKSTDVMSQKAVTENMCFGKNSTSSSTDNITIGEGASLTATHQTGQVLPSMTIGHGASSDLECISIGVDASSSEGGISIGSSTSSTKWGVAIGQSAQNTTDYGIAIGAVPFFCHPHYSLNLVATLNNNFVCLLNM